MIKSLLLSSCLLLLSTSSFALNNQLPENCAYTRQTSNDISVGEVGSAVGAGLRVYGNPYSADAWLAFAESMGELYNSFDYLRIEAPSHVILGRNFSTKGNLFDVQAYVRFFNSEKGYVGRDKSNYEANAYFDYMRFDQTRGYGLIWIERGGLCNAQGVWVQNKPIVQKINYTEKWNGGNTTVSYSADHQYSRAALENGKVKLRLLVKRRGTDQSFYTDWTEVDAYSGTVNLSFTKPANWYSASVDVRAYIDDGYLQDFVVLHARSAPPNECSFGPCNIEP